jgi:RNA polymerase sigma factor (sigma-70 family)
VSKPRITLTADGRTADRDPLTTRLLLERNPEGLRQLLVDHAAVVRGALRKEFRKVLDDLEIDEALSQASQRIWDAADRFDAMRGTLPAWFLAIARNCARRVLECRRRHATIPLAETIESEDLSGAAVAIDPGHDVTPGTATLSGFLDDLYRCIDQLPPQQRKVVLADLAAGGTAPTDELAAELRTTPNSVYVSRTNGRKTLAALLVQLGHASHHGYGGPTAAEAAS